MPTARINGVELHYREAGEGYPVLLIHGFTGNLRNWALQIAALTPGFRTISFDHRGHGHSDKPTQPEDYSLEQIAEDASGLLRHLGVDQCYVVGHSLGGMAAQRLALDHPEAVRALVLVDTAAEAPGALNTGEQGAQRRRLVQLAREEGMEAVFEEQLRLSPQREQILANPPFLEIWRRHFLLTSRDAYIHWSRGFANLKPMLDELGRLEMPTLVICGENDQAFLEPSRRIHERIRGSELAIIAGAGHTPQIEKAPEFNRVLTGFLGRVHQGIATRG